MSSVLIDNSQYFSVPGVLVFELQGVVGCLDPKLYEWLQYAPVKSKTNDSQADSSVVDPVLAEAAMPFKSKIHKQQNSL